MELMLLKARESFSELWGAILFALRDAWKNNRMLFILSASASMFVAVLPYAVNGMQALLINVLVRSVSHGVTPTTIGALIVGLGALFLLRDFVSQVFSYADRQLWFRSAEVRQTEFTAKMLELDLATHEDPKFQDDLQVLYEYGATFSASNFMDALLMTLQNIAGFLTAALIVLAIDWRLFLLVVAFSVPRLYAELRYGRGMWNFFHSNSTTRRRFRELERHTMATGSIVEIQTSQAEPFFKGRMENMLKTWFSGQIAEERQKFYLSTAAQFLATLAIAIAIGVLVYRTSIGSMQIGTLVFAITSVVGLQGSVSSFFLNLGMISRTARPTNAFREIIARKRRISLPAKPVHLMFSKAPRIEFKNVSFAYPNKTDDEVLHGLSLTIEPGERLALIGVNGSGKSTLIKLLCRFYDPTEGQVLVDGVDLKDIDLAEWYRVLALLSQDFSTYKFRVDEAISIGRVNGVPERDRIEDAAVRSEADEFISRWEHKYEQQLGTQFGGIDPSGGQQQKLAIARNLYRNAFVTILDEPTAHVDAAAEQQIFERLYGQMRRDQTLIVISHRFSTIRNADRICVMENGRVEELGSHDELMKQQGTYANLFTTQAKHYR